MVCEVDSCNNVPSLTGAVGLISLVLTGCGQRHREKAQEHMKRVEASFRRTICSIRRMGSAEKILPKSDGNNNILIMTL